MISGEGGLITNRVSRVLLKIFDPEIGSDDWMVARLYK